MLSEDPQVLHEVHTGSSVMVSMRYYVGLVTDVYTPAKNGAPLEGKFLVLLQRTPYSKTRKI